MIKRLTAILLGSAFLLLTTVKCIAPEITVEANDDCNIEIIEIVETKTVAISPKYTSLEVPNIDSSWKTWMDYRCITNTQSDQYAIIKNYGWCDNNGFMRASGERDLGISDDYYLVAMGSYYGTTMGTKFKITTDDGNVIYCMLADAKADKHTNSTHQYSFHNDVIEFLVHTNNLHKKVKLTGNANDHTPLSGSIIAIERIEFN